MTARNHTRNYTNLTDAARRHRCAGPAIILDKVEKVGIARHNGNFHDVLVGLFERETSQRWFDLMSNPHATCRMSSG
jgi:hypothetical protein